MAKIITRDYALDLTYPPFEDMNDEEFYHFCEQNKHVPIERDENHQILFMPPVSSEFASRNFILNGELYVWNARHKLGKAFDSSAGFFLPDTSMRSPDAAWISREKWDALSEEKRKGFAYIAPDFVAELVSPSDNLNDAKVKMEKWCSNGVGLGWLIDAKSEIVFIYRADGTISKVEGFDNTLSGENVLVDFQFDLKLLR